MSPNTTHLGGHLTSAVATSPETINSLRYNNTSATEPDTTEWPLLGTAYLSPGSIAPGTTKNLRDVWCSTDLGFIDFVTKSEL